jgi:hypothetical protein
MDPRRTRFAQAAVDFAGYFETMYEDLRVVGACPRKPVLRLPEGESTGGGTQSVQHILLEPEVKGHRVITVGWVNKANQTALVRTHGCLAQMHKQAFGEGKLGLDPASYQRFLDQLRNLCEAQNIDLRIQTTPPAGPRDAERDRASVRRSHRAFVLVGIVLLLFLVGATAAIIYKFYLE